MDYSDIRSAIDTWAADRLAPLLIIGIITIATSSIIIERIPYRTLSALYLVSYLASCLVTSIPIRVITVLTFRIFMLTTGLKFLGKFLIWLGTDYFYPVKAKTLCTLLAACVTICFLKEKSYASESIF
jgi:hypothetical protein